MTPQIQVTTAKVKNVYDKEQLYLIIWAGENKVIINVGNKTWQAVNKLTKPQDEQKNKKEVIK